MFLAGVILKLGSYGLFLFLPKIKHNLILTFYFSLALVGIIVGGLICLRQRDLKILIAYSSVVHMGVVSLGLLSQSEMGSSCALLIILSHGICSPLLFAFSYFLYLRSHSRQIINNYVGWPLMTACFMGLVSMNMGVPPRITV